MKSEEIKELTHCERQSFLRDFDCEELKSNPRIHFPLAVYYAEMETGHIEKIRWHWHNEFEIIYILKGEINLLLDETNLILKSGEGIILGHQIHHSLELTAQSSAVFYTILFHNDCIFHSDEIELNLKYLAPVLSHRNFDYILLNASNKHGSNIITYAKKIYEVYPKKDFGYELICKANLNLIWLEMMHLLPECQENKNQARILSNDEQRIKEAVEFIETNYAEALTLDIIAASIHISKSECCRCFQRVLHLSPFDYLLRYRIMQATKMIQQNDPLASSISNLAITVGFNNISYFNKVFKKITNMTPSEYRKKYTGIS